MTTAWGAGAWGDNSFGGPDEVFTVTGTNATGKVGYVTVFLPDVQVNIVGVKASGLVGTVVVVPSLDVPITGVSSVGTVGTVVVEAGAAATVTGVKTTGATGICTVDTTNNVYPTGVKCTGAVGNVSTYNELNALYDATGVWAIGKVGQVTTRSTWSFVDDIQSPMWQNITVDQPDSWVRVIT